ncbi:TlpA disulfide reductase family protein [Sphingomonas sp. 2R-10]|uniref:TlpA family protein disulfide reductase n=1 Tax=Sphingomonas sp. 2R-10 TaxID=3045148 RepID=UPI0019D15A7B|nr:TlpA disulfide reductase family protein [Sphingomonas sp. 2R-10]MDJ0275539.1 TlpA disulfide reductase family protein [Sphingomonas sp. 2R-10]
MRPVIALLLGLSLFVGACDKRAAAPEQAAAEGDGTVPDGTVPDIAPAANDTAPEAAAKVDRSHKGEAMPAYRFQDGAGKPVTLADFRGKPVLVNLWATWCAPCVREMPTLDALAAREGAALHLLTVSQDMEPAKVQPFLTTRKLTHLKAYRDPQLQFSTGMGVSLPTTILYDAGGKEVWRVTGGMDWAGADAAKLIGEAKA